MSTKKGPDRMTACGLTRREVAAFLGIPVKDVKSNGPRSLDPSELERRKAKFYATYGTN